MDKEFLIYDMIGYREKEEMFLDLNSVLVKFWISKGRPPKELRVELLERMLHWYKTSGTIVMDNSDGKEN